MSEFAINEIGIIFCVYMQTHLNSKTMISCDCYAVFARHCDDAATIVRHNRHLARVFSYFCGPRVGECNLIHEFMLEMNFRVK